MLSGGGLANIQYSVTQKKSPTKIFSWGEGTCTAMNELVEDRGEGVPMNASICPSSLLLPWLAEVPVRVHALQ